MATLWSPSGPAVAHVGRRILSRIAGDRIEIMRASILGSSRQPAFLEADVVTRRAAKEEEEKEEEGATSHASEPRPHGVHDLGTILHYCRFFWHYFRLLRHYLALIWHYFALFWHYSTDWAQF